MKYLARLYTLIVISLVFLFPHTAFADSSTSVNISNNGVNSQNDVNVQTNTGGNTICQNGTCTTTSGGNGQSTVCINGQCTTSGGNIDMQSNDGHDQVHISNNTSNNSVLVSPSPSPSDDTTTISPDTSVSPIPSITPDPTITQMRRQVRKQIKKQIEDLKEHIKDQDGALSLFVQSETQTLQDMLNGLFK